MRIFFLIFTGLVLLLDLSCKNSEEISSHDPVIPVIASVGEENVTLDELHAAFYRNRESRHTDSSEIREFFPSYIEYRLKLYEGYQQGFHRDSTILAEYYEYANDVAYRYWIENKIKGERIETFKDRFEHEMKAFHILKELPEDASPEDTADVYNSLITVKDSLINGALPEEINRVHSSKRDGNPVGGPLGWITAGSTIQSFEDALYSLEPGEVSHPVRTQFGYHLVILQDMRPRTPQRLVKHIFIPGKEDDTGLQKIAMAFDALEADTSWSQTVSKYSEDPATINRDGSLGWIGYGTRFPAELIDAAMEANPNAPYSKPLQMSYGYHIIKVDSVRSFENENQKEEFVVNRLQQLGRLDPERENVFDRIAAESNLLINHEAFSTLLKSGSPDEIMDSPSNSELDTELISFFNKSYTKDHFQAWLKTTSSIDAVMESGDVITSYRNFIIEKNLVEYTKAKNPGFAREVDHFLEGLIVFKVNEENIWNPLAVNREDLKAHYELNRDDYIKEKTYVYTEISGSSESLIDEVYQELADGSEINNLADHFENITIQHHSAGHSQIPVIAILEELQPGKFSEPATVDDRAFIYLLHEIKPERILDFNEAYDKVFSDYQPVREKEFIKQLTERYHLELYPENLN